MSETRERIIETARRLFHEQGYHATGIATILREADVNSGSLYHFFPSKEALLVGVLERYVDLLQPVILGPSEAAEPDPIERIFHLLGQYRAGLEATSCGMGCPIGNLALELGGGYPEARKLINRNFANWAAGIRRWLDEAGGRIPPEVDKESLADFVLTAMEGGIMQARAAGCPEPFDRCVAQLRAYLDSLVQRGRSGAPARGSAGGKAR